MVSIQWQTQIFTCAYTSHFYELYADKDVPGGVLPESEDIMFLRVCLRLWGISTSYFYMTGDMRRFPQGDLIYKRYLQRYGKSCFRQRLTEKIKELFKQVYEEN